jgi:2'-5' RNA ligase
MRKDHSLYFIAIIPPDDLCHEITRLKEDFANRFNSRHALKVIPHITLKAPFELPKANHESTLQWFKSMPVSIAPYEQELEDFGAFNNRRNPVIYVNPKMNPSLKLLQHEIVLNFIAGYPDERIGEQELTFNPHLTIAYRDLKPHFFKEAWKEYEGKKYYAAFQVSSFSLFLHDTKRWNIISTYHLP